jgi:hypothetical protein
MFLIVGVGLLFFTTFVHCVHRCDDDSSKSKLGDICTHGIEHLRPTQFTIGLTEVKKCLEFVFF